MTNEVRIRTTVKDDASKPITSIKDAWSALQKEGAKGLAIGVGAGATTTALNLVGSAVQDVTGFITDSITKASDLNETMTKSEVVFGSSASAVEDWGRTAATSMGMSDNAALAAASSIGNLLKSTGTAPDKIAPMSESLVKLAADLASFNNIPIDEALAKLQSGLVGQERPLRELGVAISAASVDAEAAALGFQKVNGQFTEGEKVQARYSLIFKQTATAQGDFARTSTGMANQQRILSAELDNTQAVLGEKLIPFVIDGQRAFIDLLGAVNPVIDGVSSLIDAMDALAGANHNSAQSTDFLGDNVTPLGKAIHGLADDVTWLVNQEQDLLGVHAKLDPVMTGTDHHIGKATDDLTTSLLDLNTAMTGTGNHAGKLADDLGVGSTRMLELQAATLEAYHATQKFDYAIKHADDTLTASQKIVQDYFDGLVAEDSYATAQAAINAARRTLASSKATAQQKKDAHSALLQAEQDRNHALETLASTGLATSKEFKKGMSALLTELGKAHGRERAEIEAEILLLETLAAKAWNAEQKLKPFGGGGNVSSFGGGRASGGPVSAGKTYVVGEEGPELLTMGGGTGYITPNAQLAQMAGGGQSVTIGPIHIYGVGSDVSPARAQEFGRRVGRASAANFRAEGARIGIHPTAP